MPERVAIVGSRNASEAVLECVLGLVGKLPAGTVVISGGAQGVDEAAIEAAKRRFDISWAIFGPKPVRIPCDNGNLYPVPVRSETIRDQLLGRNTEIARACTRMIAFPDGSKGGTWDAVRQAQRFKRPYCIAKAYPTDRPSWCCYNAAGEPVFPSEWWPEVFGE